MSAEIECNKALHGNACGKADYKSKRLVAYCIPDGELPDKIKEGYALVLKNFKESGVGAYFNDLYLSSDAIFTSMGMSIVWCFVYIGLMSMFAEKIAWCCVILTQLGLIAGTVLLVMARVDLVNDWNDPDA